MKRLVLSIVMFAVLALTGASVAQAASLSGTFRTTVSSKAYNGRLKGTWTIRFSHGVYKVTYQGTAAARGRYTVSGSSITMTKETGPAACTGTGHYAFKRKGKSLTFTRQAASSACAGRDAVLSFTFKKVS